MLIIPSSELRVWAAQSGSQSATQPKYSSQTQFTTIFCWELEVFKKDTRGPLRFHCLSGSASPWPWILTAFFPSAVMLMSLCAVISVGLWLVNCARPEADWHQTQSLRAQALDAVTKWGAHTMRRVSCLESAPCFIIFLVARILCKIIQPFSCRDLFPSVLIMRKS